MPESLGNLSVPPPRGKTGVKRIVNQRLEPVPAGSDLDF